MPDFMYEGCKINYIDEGSGYPVILFHGLGGALSAITSVYSPRKGYRLVSLDFPGHGKSEYPGPGYLSFTAMADLAVELKRQLCLPPAVIGGISMGAGVALNVVLRYPDEFTGLIMVRPAWKDGPMESKARETYAEIYRYINEESGKPALLESDFYKNIEAGYPALASSLSALLDYPEAARTADKFLLMPADRPTREAPPLETIDKPTLILSTRQDFVHPYEYGEYYAERIKGAVFRELVSKSVDAAGHNRDLRNNIDGFLDKI